MSYETIDKTIEILDKLTNEYELVMIEVFGGEALMAFDKFKYLIEKIKEKQYTNIYLTLFTNCILLNNDEISTYLVENQNYIKGMCLSLDGGEKSHNSTRIYPNGEGSFKDVISGIKNYARIKGVDIKNFVPSFTVSPDNQKYLLESIIELKELGFKRVAAKPVRDGVWTDEALREYKEIVLKLKKWFIDNIESEFDMSILTLPVQIEQNKYRPRYCGGGRDLYSITPTGEIYPCPRFYFNKSPYKLGSIFEKEYFTNKSFQILFNKYNRTNFVNCSNCDEFKNKHCLGMCLAAAYEDSGKLFTTIPNVCEIIKFNYKIAKEVESELKNNIHYQNLLKNYY